VRGNTLGTTVELSSPVRFNLGASGEGESLGDPSVEFNSSARLHIDRDLGWIS